MISAEGDFQRCFGFLGIYAVRRIGRGCKRKID